MPFSFSVALQVATPDGRHSFTMFHAAYGAVASGEWILLWIVRNYVKLPSPHAARVFLPGWDIAHWQCCVMILEGNAWWRSSFQTIHLYGMSIHPEKHTDVQLCTTKCIPALITEHQINCRVPRTRAEAAEAAEASRRRRAETLLSALVSRSLMKAALRAEDGLRGNNLEGPWESTSAAIFYEGLLCIIVYSLHIFSTN